ncbi:MAG: hypothetical protein FWG68_01080, partial [Defluviitaleaceae bacterium]|nr:hypothetical protein [Defluviitaleaceae bacterium]
ETGLVEVIAEVLNEDIIVIEDVIVIHEESTTEVFQGTIHARQVYYAVIRGIPFQLHSLTGWDFVPPTRAELAFVGLETDLRVWEEEIGRIPAVMSKYRTYEPIDPLGPTPPLLAIGMYNENNELLATILHVLPQTPVMYGISTETDSVEFLGTWGQILDDNILNLADIEPDFIPTVDGSEYYSIIFQTQSGFDRRRMALLQDLQDWNFIPPSSVEMSYEDGLVIFRMYDENNVLLAETINSSLTFDYEPVFTIIAFGTTEELREIGI